MADRGFTIVEDLLIRNARLHMPPGKRGNEQLTKSEVKKKQMKWQIFAVLLNKPFFALKHSA